jgi:hypothetical protein
MLVLSFLPRQSFRGDVRRYVQCQHIYITQLCFPPDSYQDMVTTGIIDPAKVTRSALQNEAG